MVRFYGGKADEITISFVCEKNRQIDLHKAMLCVKR